MRSRVRERLVRHPSRRRGRWKSGTKPRVLCFIVAYPTFSETYMHEEIRSLRDRFDIEVVTYKVSRTPRRRPFPYRVVPYDGPDWVYGSWDQADPTFRQRPQRAFLREVDEIIEAFQPDLLHGHYLGMALLLRCLAERHELPFTIRTHSQDVLSEPADKLAGLCAAADSEWCERVLAFPANCPRLERHGLSPTKLVATPPVLNFARFARPETTGSPPTGRVMCAGPAIPKKAHHEFVDLARSMRGSGLHFDLHTAGPSLEDTRAYNADAGGPVTITYTDPDDMPETYPRYDWLVYTADRKINKVGLPVAVTEAQASGLGVCLQELPGRRDEQLDFLGGGGFLFRSVDEVPDIISRPYPDDMRSAGIEAARRCDIEQTKHLLADGWDRCLVSAR